MGDCLELLLGVLDTSSLSALASATALLPGPVSTLLLGLLLLLDKLRGTGILFNRTELICSLLVLLGVVTLSL